MIYIYYLSGIDKYFLYFAPKGNIVFFAVKLILEFCHGATVIVAGLTKDKMQHKTGQERIVVEPREQAVYYRIERTNIA